MKVIIAGFIDLEDPSQVKEMLTSARPHIEGALEEKRLHRLRLVRRPPRTRPDSRL